MCATWKAYYNIIIIEFDFSEWRSFSVLLAGRVRHLDKPSDKGCLLSLDLGFYCGTERRHDHCAVFLVNKTAG